MTWYMRIGTASRGARRCGAAGGGWAACALTGPVACAEGPCDEPAQPWAMTSTAHTAAVRIQAGAQRCSMLRQL